ncbi:MULTISPECIES: DotI/IcmL family type IV secretion protein [unclassified Legionella]|uniref:DotI/IcmL family type IV secretion protein n=1 Tax=unclassified Legionella TaxID=2622702 RepID=UPI001E3C49CB|nr:DotI/IcmL family type IV secretion protein [Legionella sp. 31fI33]MCC5013534.1 DotI/IcmL family type IV secretion protein [Legionella sp. 31fI33]
MKKNILYGALVNLICIEAQAMQYPDPSTAILIGRGSVIKQSVQSGLMPPKQDNGALQEAHSFALPQPQEEQNTQSLFPEQQQADTIDCDYKIPVEISNISLEFVINWAQQAVRQSFDFNFASVDTQLEKLQACYTESGWVKFKSALQSSGNVDVIKTQNLAVSSQIDGQAQLIEFKDYLWKMNVPLKVVYQSDEERVTHFLNIYLTVGRKINGNLGIMQMIATPRFAPISLKSTSVDKAVGGMYQIVAKKKAETLNAVQKNMASFFMSLFPQRIGLRAPTNTAQPRQFEHIAQLPPYPLPQRTQAIQRMPIAQGQEEPNSNFGYKTLAEITQMHQNFILFGLNQALIQSFDFKYKFLDTPVQQFHSWYAENGEVRTAAQKSDSISANSTQKTAMNSPMYEAARLSVTDNDQWKITLPLNLADANNKNKVTQLHVTIGWKITANDFRPRIVTASRPSVHPTIQAASPNAGISAARVNQATEAMQKIQANNPMQQAQASIPQQLPQLVLQNPPTPQSAIAAQSQVLNCDYKTPAGTTPIDQAIVLRWAEYAAMQSFNFNSELIDTQLQRLQACFTKKGWVEFQTAMYKSGNIEAIKTLQITMSSEIARGAQLLEAKGNQWKIELPLKVLYQSDKGKAVQLVNINLIVNRKITGELGIRRMIATLSDTSAPSDLPHS